MSRSHAGEVKSLIGEKLKQSEIIIAAGSGKYWLLKKELTSTIILIDLSFLLRLQNTKFA